MRKILIILLIVITASVFAQTHVAEQHYSTESVRLKDKVVTDIVTTISNESTDSEVPTAKAVYEYGGSSSSIGVEFEYSIIFTSIPTLGEGFFRNDTIIIHETDRRSIGVGDAIDQSITVSVRSEQSYITYNIASISYNNVHNYYLIIIELGKGSIPEPLESSIRYLTFTKSTNTGGALDSLPDANLLGYEFQYEGGEQPVAYGKLYIGTDTIDLYEQDRRGIYINHVLPTASHVRLRDDSTMISYEILSTEYLSGYYRILINIGKGTPDVPVANEVKYVSFINIIEPSGLELITQNGKTGWWLIGSDETYNSVTGNEAINLSIQDGGGSYGGGVSGDKSAVFGYNNNVTGSNGDNANGYNNYVIGSIGANANGYNNYVGSHSANANGNGNFVTGDDGSNVNGENNKVYGDQAANANGYNNEVNGEYGSNANGYYNQTSGDYGANSNGMGTSAHNNSQTAIGKYNIGTATTTLLEVGIGTNSGNKDNALEVHTTGEVTIPHYSVHSPTTAPSPAVIGMMYTSDINNHLYYYDGTSWVDLTLSAAGILNVNDAGDYNTSGITDWSVPKWSSSTGKWIMDVDSTSIGLSSDYKLKLNAADATPNYLDDKLLGGNFVTLSNASEIKTITVNVAIPADLEAASDVNKVIKPSQLPRVKLKSETDYLEGVETHSSDGLQVKRVMDDADHIIYEHSLQTGSLSTTSPGYIGLDDYVIVNAYVDQTVRYKIGYLLDLLQQSQLSLDIIPDGRHSFTLTSGTFSSFTLTRGIEVYEWNGTEVLLSEGVLTFENAVNCSALASASKVASITVNGGTYLNDGSVYASIDFVFTRNNGAVARKTFKVLHAGTPIF
ncbi:MAG: hypothetical protein GQ527_07140 [Bacteroidales bacterium]|nr:hypothetical protein [Bacteroidales bacterium]